MSDGLKRPYTTVVLAMSADGKIADAIKSPARFSAKGDRSHLEQQIALSDAVLFGAATLRAYGTTLTISDPQLLQQREQKGKPPQPVQIVASRHANLNPQIRFFRQPVTRWLLTTKEGKKQWEGCAQFDEILIYEKPETGIDWKAALQQLATLGIERLAVLGGGFLVASMLEEDLLDEFWFTICPVILGGETSPTPVAGKGFYEAMAPRLQLLSVFQVEQEIFLNYRLQR